MFEELQNQLQGPTDQAMAWFSWIPQERKQGVNPKIGGTPSKMDGL